jgi:DNA-binding protein YbaB
MFRFILLAILATGSYAQNADDVFNKPPADVDQALRARITEFYDLHVKGEFRKAEAWVAEDTREIYYSSSKTKYLSFDIGRIEYADDFTRAKATVLCEQYIMLPGFMGKPFRVPIPSTWKLVDGIWYWYVDPESLRMTPFGKMNPGSAQESASASIPAIPTTVPDYIYKQVNTDKESVSLKTGESERVTITNSAPGIVNISLTGSLAGVEVKLDRTILNAGEKAVLTVHAGHDAKSGVLSIQVEQTNQVIPIQVAIK